MVQNLFFDIEINFISALCIIYLSNIINVFPYVTFQYIFSLVGAFWNMKYINWPLIYFYLTADLMAKIWSFTSMSTPMIEIFTNVSFQYF